MIPNYSSHGSPTLNKSLDTDHFKKVINLDFSPCQQKTNFLFVLLQTHITRTFCDVSRGTHQWLWSRGISGSGSCSVNGSQAHNLLIGGADDIHMNTSPGVSRGRKGKSVQFNCILELSSICVWFPCFLVRNCGILHVSRRLQR